MEEYKGINIMSQEMFENLEKKEQLGTGTGGVVYKVFVKTEYALKELNKSKTEINDFKNIKNFIKEYEIMNKLHHPNIMETFEISFNSKKYPPSILLEFCPYNLEQSIKKQILSNDQIAFAIYQIAEGMKCVHFNNIIHRDLKPSNIFIAKDGTIKIGDFGVSKLMTLEEQSSTGGVGTQKYMAPEVIDEDENYNEKVDVYSFGVVCFFILSGGDLPKIKMSDILKGKKAELPEKFTEFNY